MCARGVATVDIIIVCGCTLESARAGALVLFGNAKSFLSKDDDRELNARMAMQEALFQYARPRNQDPKDETNSVQEAVENTPHSGDVPAVPELRPQELLLKRKRVVPLRSADVQAVPDPRTGEQAQDSAKGPLRSADVQAAPDPGTGEHAQDSAKDPLRSADVPTSGRSTMPSNDFEWS